MPAMFDLRTPAGHKSYPTAPGGTQRKICEAIAQILPPESGRAERLRGFIPDTSMLASLQLGLRRHILQLLAAVLAGGVVTSNADAAFNWTYSTPEEQGVDSTQLARMYAQILREQPPIHSFLLVRHDQIVSEIYLYPYNATTKHPLYSVSKSFTSALVGIAIEQQLLSGVDEKIEDLFQGVTTQPVAENMHRMALRHLLTMSSGHALDTTQRLVNTSNWEKTFMELPVENAPGSAFVYNSGGSYMLASAVQRRAGMTAASFAQRNLFTPLGITDYTWDLSPTNVICGGWGLSLRPLDMARFGVMYLHRGKWDGQQIVPAAWVDESSRMQIANGSSGFWGSGYGFQFWLNDFGGYRADGAFAQFIFILPEYDAVAVFTCNFTSDSEYPARLMRQYVLPAMKAEAMNVNPRGCALLQRDTDSFGVSPALAPTSPNLLSLPADQTVATGKSVTFSVTASGSPAPSLQWHKDEIAIPGATSASLTMDNVTPSSSGEYAIVLRNSSGAIASPPVKLTVLGSPTILAQPMSIETTEGEVAFFEVQATGGDLTYEWKRHGISISGASEPTLTLTNVSADDAGDYTVVVSNSLGRVESSIVKLVVASSDERAHLVNLSVRSFAGTSDQTLIVGLVIGGSEPTLGLPVLVRGVGPSLSSLNVGGTLVDPASILFAGATPIRSCSDWCGRTDLTETARRVGAFPFQPRSADASIHTVLKPGAYTMHVVSSLPDKTGVALAECYDAGGTPTHRSPRLVNLSARARAGTGDETLIGGFVIRGAGTMRVLIRGIGPTLSSQHVAGVLADPELRLFAKETLIASNDDWDNLAESRSLFTKVGAFDLPADAKDAALIVTLPAGIYTAHVGGKNGATGVAMVEIYAVP